MASSHRWKKGETTAISGTLKDSNRDAVDIAGATLVFQMEKSDGQAVVNAAASNDQVGDGSDGTKGKWSYDPVTADTDEAGTFYGEVEVTFTDGKIGKYPKPGRITIFVEDDIA